MKIKEKSDFLCALCKCNGYCASVQEQIMSAQRTTGNYRVFNPFKKTL